MSELLCSDFKKVPLKPWRRVPALFINKQVCFVADFLHTVYITCSITAKYPVNLNQYRFNFNLLPTR